MATGSCRCVGTLFSVQVDFLVSLLLSCSDRWQMMPQEALVAKKNVRDKVSVA